MRNSNFSWLRKLCCTVCALLVVAAVAAISVYVLTKASEKHATWVPNYEVSELSDLVNRDILTEFDYNIILKQTGLGKPAVDSIRLMTKDEQKRAKLFKDYQKLFFSSGDYVCNQIGIITFEEKIWDNDGNLVKGFQIADIKNGDVLISKSTHSLGWRHGHAAIVIDAEKGLTLEAVLLGQNSALQDISKWQSYSTFGIFRLKTNSDLKGKEIAEFASQTLNDIPYGLFAGLPVKFPDRVGKTQCAHLVWYPYKQYGYDIDSDKGWLVTPKDIANSPVFELVQVFGADPEAFWP